MNVSLEPDNVFTVVIGTHRLTAMREVSRWEGFIKLEGEAGIVIVSDPRGAFTRSLDTAFDAPVRDGYALVMASPAILSLVQRHAGDATDKAPTP